VKPPPLLHTFLPSFPQIHSLSLSPLAASLTPHAVSIAPLPGLCQQATQQATKASKASFFPSFGCCEIFGVFGVV